MNDSNLPEGLYYPTYRDKATGELRRSSIIWCRYYRNGKKIAVSTETDNLRKAVKFRARCVGGDKPITTALARTTFEDLAKLVTQNYELKGFRSARRIKEAFAHLREFLEFDLARDIGSDRLAQYVESRRKQKASNATINRELSGLRKGFRLAAQADPPKVDRVPHFELLQEANARKGFFEREDFDAVQVHLPHYLKAPLLVAYITGWRLASEVLTRKRSHLNLTTGVLRLDPITGHKTDSIFARYAIVDQSMIDDAATKLALILRADQQRPQKVAGLGGKA